MDAVDPRPLVLIVGRGVLLLNKIMLGLAPGLRITMCIVKHLPESIGAVAPVFKKFGKRFCLRLIVAEVRFVVVGLCRIRAETREHAGARRPADCILGVGMIKECSSFREPVDIRRMNVRCSVAIEFGTEIVDTDYQYIW